MKKIYFITPYLSRDLPGNCLIGYYLENIFGLKVEYLNGYNVLDKIRKHKHVAIIFDHLEWKFKADQIKYAKSLGIKTIVLPTEGLFVDEETVIRTSGKLNDALPYVDLQFSWGSFVQETLLKNNLISSQKLFLMGSPRFDFYSERFIKYEESKLDFYTRLNLKIGKPLILWATNTVYVGADHDKIRKKYIKNSHNSEQFIQDVINNELYQFEDQMAIFKQLVLDRPDWNFVIKVHPAEQVKPYEELANQFQDRVFLFYNQPITKFLIHCDILFQRNCTTANEAWMLGKPVIQTECREYPRIGRVEFLEANDVVKNYVETLNIIEHYLNGGQMNSSIKDCRETFIKSYFGKIDGYAYKRVAEKIGDFLNETNFPLNEAEQVISKIDKEAKNYQNIENRRLTNILKDLFHIERTHSLKFWKKQKVKDKTEGEREAQEEEIQNLYKKYSEMDLLNKE
jgi:surface carbohydrate biosynthesis protein